ncbi:hypothetical protein HZC31_06915 [Candidatus Woesearchaeota archaeon]|nr:hypothetical protein [Candidatus Woesearchaeota archaeon]
MDDKKEKTEHSDLGEDLAMYQIRDATTSSETPASHAHSQHQKTAGAPSHSDESSTSTSAFFIGLGIFILVLLTIFLIPRFFDQDPQTLTELHQETVEEELDEDDRYTYNGYSFVYYDGLWYTQIYNSFSEDLYDVPLHYGPKNLTDIIITGDVNPFFNAVLMSNLSNTSLRYYLTFNPTDENLGYVALASGELSQNLVTTFNIAPVSACTVEDAQCASVPIVTCDSTTEPVIYIKSGTPTLIYANGNCITIQGEQAELVRAVDRFLYKLYNIMI